MFDQLNEQTIVDQVIADNSNIQQQPVVEKADVPETKPERKEDHPNFKTLRERAEQAERRAQELERYVQSLQPQQPQQPAQEEQETYAFEDDTYVEGKQLKRELKNIKKELRETRKQLQEVNQQTSSSSAELRLKARYTDFDAVVNQENIRRLAEERPSLYRSVLANPDLYEKGESVYEIIKSVFAPRDRYEAQDRKIEENAQKPRSAATAQASTSPLASIQDYDRRILTEDRKRQLREQVRNAKMYR